MHQDPPPLGITCRAPALPQRLPEEHEVAPVAGNVSPSLESEQPPQTSTHHAWRLPSPPAVLQECRLRVGDWGWRAGCRELGAGEHLEIGL